MRIGILTVPFNNNYGGYLQAYALKKVLTDMGHEVIFINRRRNKSKGIKTSLQRILKSCHLKQDKYARKIAEISIYTNQFKAKYLEPITEEYYTTKELKKCLTFGIDCFVVGSDQVWRYEYAKDSINDFFFSFLKGTDIPRFSYAASMGTDEMEYPDDKLQECSELLKTFIGVSVREISTLYLLAKNFGYKNAQLVLDPTMLLSFNEYKRLFKDINPSTKSPYVFTYILDETEEKSAIIEKVMNNRNLKRINMKAQTGTFSTMSVIEPVEKWLSAIYYSDFVVTDSFHGIVFSIIFKKPFIAIGNPLRGMVRMTDLLCRLCLENHIITKAKDAENIINGTIDWKSVNMAIQEEKAQSVSFLKKALSSF